LAGTTRGVGNATLEGALHRNARSRKGVAGVTRGWGDEGKGVA